MYDRLCHTALADRPVRLSILGMALVTAVAFGLTHVFGPRAAYIHVGAMIGTIMAANVFFVIIPAQRELVEAIEEGRAPDAAIGAHAAARSRHNNYFTLPVLFVMISTHYPITYGHAWSWVILAGLFVIGATTRHGFNVRNAGRSTGWIFPAAALAMLALALVAGRTRARDAVGAAANPVSYARVREIIVARCLTCHSEEPANTLFDAPPGGIVLETPEEVAALRDRIRAMAVDSKVMPLGNFTGMTDEERSELGRWIADGALTDR